MSADSVNPDSYLRPIDDYRGDGFGTERRDFFDGSVAVANSWFESVAEAQRRAKKRLPPSVHSALLAGSERGQTIEDDIGAFAELDFAPHSAGNSPERDLSTAAMGQPISVPAGSSASSPADAVRS